MTDFLMFGLCGAIFIWVVGFIGCMIFECLDVTFELRSVAPNPDMVIWKAFGWPLVFSGFVFRRYFGRRHR